tara:strand:+ start:1449 stop:1886 length:438 start_codon:yes stop_codon:yes gene_type:complete
MANNASNYLESALLNHIFSNNGGAAYSAPADNSIYVSLHTTAGPLDDNSGTGTEITLGSYARSNASNTLTWTVSQSGGTTTATNDQAIPFPQATANYDGQVTHIGIYDNSTGGNLLFHGALTVAKTVTTGDTFQINAGSLTITLE